MPCAGNLRQVVQNIAPAVEANAFDDIRLSSGIELIRQNRVVVPPLSLELL